MDDWLSRRADALAALSGLDRGTFELSEDEVSAVLDLAAMAAHESGERINAPLLCYLVGRARAAGASLDELVAAVRGSTS